jgi:hypothetical protein
MNVSHIVRTALLIAGAMLTMYPAAALAQKKNRDLITRDEIMNSAQREQDLWQAVRGLRPHFLAPPRGVRTMGNAPAGETVVVVDGKRDSGLDALRMIMASDVEEVRYLDPSRSQNEFGTFATGGAVVVKLRKGDKLALPTRDTVKPPSL